MSGAPGPEQRSAAETERDRLISNEQIKLRATLLNTVSAGCIVAGIITPTVAAFRVDAAPSGAALVLTIVWFLLAVARHVGAVLTLERLR